MTEISLSDKAVTRAAIGGALVGGAIGVAIGFNMISTDNERLRALATNAYLPARNSNVAIIANGLAPAATATEQSRAAALMSNLGQQGNAFPDISDCLNQTRKLVPPSAELKKVSDNSIATVMTGKTYDRAKLTACLNQLIGNKTLPTSIEEKYGITRTDAALRHLIPAPPLAAVGTITGLVLAGVVALSRRQRELEALSKQPPAPHWFGL